MDTGRYNGPLLYKGPPSNTKTVEMKDFAPPGPEEGLWIRKMQARAGRMADLGGAGSLLGPAAERLVEMTPRRPGARMMEGPLGAGVRLERAPKAQGVVVRMEGAARKWPKGELQGGRVWDAKEKVDKVKTEGDALLIKNAVMDTREDAATTRRALAPTEATHERAVEGAESPEGAKEARVPAVLGAVLRGMASARKGQAPQQIKAANTLRRTAAELTTVEYASMTSASMTDVARALVSAIPRAPQIGGACRE